MFRVNLGLNRRGLKSRPGQVLSEQWILRQRLGLRRERVGDVGECYFLALAAGLGFGVLLNPKVEALAIAGSVEVTDVDQLELLVDVE